MPEDFRGGTPYLTVEGTALDDDTAGYLVDVRVEQSLHLPDIFTVRLSDHLFRVFDAAKFEIGKKVKIEFQAGNDKETVTEGEITAVAVEPGPDGRHELVVTGMDKTHRLHRGAKVRTLQKMKDSQAVQSVASDAGLQAQVKATTTEQEYLMQYQTDADFIGERAHAVGHGWWFADGKFNFKSQEAAGSPVTLQWGENLLKFNVRMSAGESITDAEVRGWDPTTQKQITGSYTAKANEAELGSGAKAATDAAKAAKKFNRGRLGLAAPVLDSAEAKALAQSVVERGAAEQVVARGEARGNPKIKPGIKAKLTEVGTRLSGDYLLTSVVHVWGRGRPYVTRFESGGKRPADLVGLLRSNQDGGLGDKMLIGIVENLKDPENSGRVRVKFPAVSDEDTSAWARLLMPGAGPGRGLIMYPEINDEVLVAFEHGDLRRPVILGGLWSKKNASPELGNDKEPALSDGKVDNRGWKSQAGHSLKITDKSGAEEIALAHKDTSALVLSHDKVSLDSRQPVEFTGDKTYDSKFDGDMTVDGKGKINIKAGMKLMLEAATEVEIKVGGSSIKITPSNIDIVAAAMLSAKGNASAKLEGGGMTEVKGGIVKIN